MRNADQSATGTPDDFDAVARRYWSAWSDALRAAAPGVTATPDASPWQPSLDWWTSMAKNGGQPASDDALDRFNTQARQWFGTMQQVASQFAGRDAGPANIVAAWKQAMGGANAAGGFNPMGAAPWAGMGASPFMAGAGAMPGMAGFGAMPGMDGNPFAAMMQGIQQSPGAHGFDHWFAQVAPWLKSLQAGASGMPSMPDMAWFLQSPTRPQMLQMPTFGHNRERDARWQSLVRVMGELQQRMQAYNALMQRATQDAYAVFEGKLAEREEPGRQLTSGRALFDLWIDSAEEAYARIALTDEFRGVYGELVNAQMRVRGAVQVEVEHACAQLGMPTRTELDGAHRKIVELERQMRRLRDLTSPRVETSSRTAARAPAPLRHAQEPRRPVPTKPTATRNAAVPVKTVTKKAVAKKSGSSPSATKQTVTPKVASKKPLARKVAAKNAKKTVTRTIVTKKSAARKTRSGRPSTAKTALPSVTPRAARTATRKSSAKTRPAAKKSAPRARAPSRRTASTSAARRASPAAARTAAKRAPSSPSRRSALSVFVDTPMPIAPVLQKGKR